MKYLASTLTIALLCTFGGCSEDVAGPNLSPKPPTPPVQPPRFSTPITIPTDQQPEALVLADMNGDQLIDIVVDSRSTYSIHLNQGNRTFAAPLVGPPIVHSSAAAAGDLDGDGDNDLVVCRFWNELILLFNNGDGTFGSQVSHATSHHAGDVEICDLDGDLDLDIALSGASDTALVDTSSSLLVFENIGAGEFVFKSRYRSGRLTYNLAAADLDGDDDIDMAFSDHWSSASQILLNDGAGNFSERPGGPLEVGDRVDAICAGDLDLDGDSDLIYARSYTTGGLVFCSIAVHRNLGGSAFDAGTVYDAAYGFHYDIVAGDLNGDTYPELVASMTPNDVLNILTNLRDGRFGEIAKLRTDNFPVLTRLADLDNDGWLDMVTAAELDDLLLVFWNVSGHQ